MDHRLVGPETPAEWDSSTAAVTVAAVAEVVEV